MSTAAKHKHTNTDCFHQYGMKLTSNYTEFVPLSLRYDRKSMTVWMMSSSAILNESAERKSWPSSSLQSTYVSSKWFHSILMMLMGEILFHHDSTASLHE